MSKIIKGCGERCLDHLAGASWDTPGLLVQDREHSQPGTDKHTPQREIRTVQCGGEVAAAGLWLCDESDH